MKCINMMAELRGDTSPPSRGAWIEMLIVAGLMISAGVSPPSRGAWIEIRNSRFFVSLKKSPPSRGAWIEIAWSTGTGYWCSVAPLAGGVD